MLDAICTVNDDYDDVQAMAENLGQIFRGAYCVLAATRAMGQDDGFIKSRLQREYVTFQRGAEKPFYVCEAIDDFDHDVIKAPLHQLAWCLQERAMAQRTIYFAEAQTYFECGRGIRCETLAKMHK